MTEPKPTGFPDASEMTRFASELRSWCREREIGTHSLLQLSGIVGWAETCRCTQDPCCHSLAKRLLDDLKFALPR